jgi:hypothetical protein
MNDQTEDTINQATISESTEAELEHETANPPDMGSQEPAQANDTVDAQTPDAKAESSAPAEDSGEAAIKKEEAAVARKKAEQTPEWRRELKRFHNDINGILAAKENYKLVCVDQNAKPSFARTWKQESNRYFQLMVNLRRRARGAKVGGKNVA